jgi:tetratricopeptide (TPR) repeat protein
MIYSNLEHVMMKFSVHGGLGVWVATVVVAVGLVLTASCTNPTGEVVRLKEAGDDAYRRGDYLEAERQYQAAVKKAEGADPTNGLTLICLRSLADVYNSQGRKREAEAIYKRRVELVKHSPKNPAYDVTVYDDLATLYILDGRIEEAKPIYQKAITLTKTTFGDKDPKVSEKVDYYVQLLKAKNQEAEAAHLLSRAAESSNSSP